MIVNNYFNEISAIFPISGEYFFRYGTGFFEVGPIYCNWVMNVKRPKYLLWIVAVEAVGILSGLLTRQGTILYQMTAQKPALTPPGIVFPIVWTILYALMGIGAARVAAQPAGRARADALNVFVIQLVVNFFWSLLFFNAQAYGFALLWLLLLWILILIMMVLFWRVDRISALLQIPYLLWVTFAAYLNYAVWQLNR